MEGEPCCKCTPAKTQEEFVQQLFLCPAKRKIAINSVVGVVTGTAIMLSSAKDYLYNFVFGTKASSLAYQSFALTAEEAANDFGAISINTAPIMLGDQQNNILTADAQGSKIWAKQGLNFMTANEGADSFYFSLCSTKIIDQKVSVIQNFDKSHDKLKFFCTKYQIKPEDISIQHQANNTCIEVKGAIDTSVICLLGNIDIQANDIILTTLGEVQQDLGL